jgi:hypothetical protein
MDTVLHKPWVISQYLARATDRYVQQVTGKFGRQTNINLINKISEFQSKILPILFRGIEWSDASVRHYTGRTFPALLRRPHKPPQRIHI